MNSELQVFLEHLVLAGQNEDGELEWIGTEEQWQRVRAELDTL